MSRFGTRWITLGVAVLSIGCEPAATDPSPGGPSLAIAAPIQTQVLPSPLASHALVYGVSSAGFVIASFQNAAGGWDAYAWTSPYGSPATLIGNGALGSPSTLNGLGDTPGEDGQQVAGAWLRGATDWSFQPVSKGPYSNVVTMAMNDSRQIVGGSYGTSRHALWWSSALAQPTELPIPALPGRPGLARGRALNNVGTLVGEIYDTVGTGRRVQVYQHGIVWTGSAEGWSAALLPDMAVANVPFAINDAGQILGVLGSAPGSAYGVGVWTPSASGYAANVISDSWVPSGLDRCGRIAGTRRTNKGRTALLWANGVETALPTPAGYAEADTRSISTDAATGEGVVVGTAYPKGNGSRVAVRWTIAGCP